MKFFILYSLLEPDIQDRLDEEELKTTAIVPFENKVNFVIYANL